MGSKQLIKGYQITIKTRFWEVFRMGYPHK